VCCTYHCYTNTHTHTYKHTHTCTNAHIQTHTRKHTHTYTRSNFYVQLEFIVSFRREDFRAYVTLFCNCCWELKNYICLSFFSIVFNCYSSVVTLHIKNDLGRDLIRMITLSVNTSCSFHSFKHLFSSCYSLRLFLPVQHGFW